MLIRKSFFQYMKNVLRVVTNKYFITAFAFVIWSLFFDQNDWFTIREKEKELNKLEGNITYLQKEIARMDGEREALTSNAAVIEQYARETYRMKRLNEDVYVIDDAK